MFNIKPIITLGMIENIHNSNNIIYASQILGNELITTSFKSLYLNFMNSEYTTETFILILENKTMKIILNKIDENQVILEENFPMYFFDIFLKKAFFKFKLTNVPKIIKYISFNTIIHPIIYQSILKTLLFILSDRLNEEKRLIKYSVIEIQSLYNIFKIIQDNYNLIENLKDRYEIINKKYRDKCISLKALIYKEYLNNLSKHKNSYYIKFTENIQKDIENRDITITMNPGDEVQLIGCQLHIAKRNKTKLTKLEPKWWRIDDAAQADGYAWNIDRNIVSGPVYWCHNNVLSLQTQHKSKMEAIINKVKFDHNSKIKGNKVTGFFPFFIFADDNINPDLYLFDDIRSMLEINNKELKKLVIYNNHILTAHYSLIDNIFKIYLKLDNIIIGFYNPITYDPIFDISSGVKLTEGDGIFTWFHGCLAPKTIVKSEEYRCRNGNVSCSTAIYYPILEHRQSILLHQEIDNLKIFNLTNDLTTFEIINDLQYMAILDTFKPYIDSNEISPIFNEMNNYLISIRELETYDFWTYQTLSKKALISEKQDILNSIKDKLNIDRILLKFEEYYIDKYIKQIENSKIIGHFNLSNSLKDIILMLEMFEPYITSGISTSEFLNKVQEERENIFKIHKKILELTYNTTNTNNEEIRNLLTLISDQKLIL